MQSTGAKKPSLAGAAWLKSVPLSKVIAALSTSGGDVRAVGGAVRNTLSGRPITDIDLATPLLPADVMRRATAAGLAVHPTGIDHGTVTVVADDVPFEVTTLRRDVETDGRRAVVAFSTDWREDAARRDFTINALYASPQGEVFDYFGGIADLDAGLVRFIGNAAARIREDYLRILRFFRFNAEYGQGRLDPESLAACIDLRDGISRLSAERVGAELMKLVAAPRAAEVAQDMSRAGILSVILGSPGHPERLSRLQKIETALSMPVDNLARLAALALNRDEDAPALSKRLRLSNDQAAKIAAALSREPGLDPATSEAAGRAALYRLGACTFRRAALVDWAALDASPNDEARRLRTTLADRWVAPSMPVRGADVLALGVKSGQSVGKILDAFEQWWVAEDFPADPALHKNQLRALAEMVTKP